MEDLINTGYSYRSDAPTQRNDFKRLAGTYIASSHSLLSHRLPADELRRCPVRRFVSYKYRLHSDSIKIKDLKT
nr:MAG TPA: hypothetical protein [Caudoviricetes sp.]